ncbi:MAG: tricarballylate utilization 4Fe-4S protein TcuB [Deltaproteobacteria bacterium]|nr:tricarballylate utilization 4Fe-4S protein TcuB [Deltaproteobacteria bacterium]
MSSDRLKEAERVLTICNACRYCEGYCAVFPAMELRRTFTAGDLKYLSNLCHNCRDCYYACQYAPPHDFSLNFPRAMADLRMDTYSEFTWPRFLSGSFKGNGLAVFAISVMSIVAFAAISFASKGVTAIFGTHQGPNSFYRIVSYITMIWPFFLLAIFAIVSLWKGAQYFWQETVSNDKPLFDKKAHFQAIWDVLRLKYLDGGGHGCNFPDDRFSMIRRYLHHFVFYGFMLCLASTTVAAIYDHLFHIPAPYPFFSWPVMLGTIGGLALLVGTGGLLVLKFRMDRLPAADKAYGMDIGFISLLFTISLTGLVLLVFRETAAMGTLLIVHLGLVLAFFITIPYGKFVHALYRYTALVRYAQEQSEAE